VEEVPKKRIITLSDMQEAKNETLPLQAQLWRDLVKGHTAREDAFTPEETQELSDMWDFVGHLALDQCDEWVGRGFIRGDWYLGSNGGRLEIMANVEKYDSQERAHIATQVFDALARTPNRYFSVIGDT
jgi:hypothetical protein